MAYLIDANGEELDVGSPAILDDISLLSIYCWIRVTTDTTTRRILDKMFQDGASTRKGWALTHSSTDKLKFRRMWSGTANGANWTTTSLPQSTTWVHVAVTYDKGSSSNDPVMYYDAVSQSITEVVTPSGSVVDDSLARVTIGNLNHNSQDGARPINGRICAVGIHNVILTQGEIAQARVRGYVHRGLVGFWPMYNDGVDLSGNGNNATVTNATVADHAPIASSFGFDMGWAGISTVAAPVGKELLREYPRGVNRGILRGVI